MLGRFSSRINTLIYSKLRMVFDKPNLLAFPNLEHEMKSWIKLKTNDCHISLATVFWSTHFVRQVRQYAFTKRREILLKFSHSSLRCVRIVLLLCVKVFPRKLVRITYERLNFSSMCLLTVGVVGRRGGMETGKGRTGSETRAESTHVGMWLCVHFSARLAAPLWRQLF